MSAESPRRGVRSGGLLVRPQPVSEKTVIDSVVDIIHNVANSTGSGSTVNKGESREKVQWVRFQKADINDVNGNPDYNSNLAPPLLLVIGYANGAQIWSIAVSGEAQEVLSLRQCPIRFLEVLQTPKPSADKVDAFAKKRPLVAACDGSSASRPFCNLRMLSLRNGEEVHAINFDQQLADVKSNERVIAASYQEMIRVFDTSRFQEMFRISACYPAPGLNPNPLALGSRWLAYADKKLVAVHQSCGGMSGDGGQSYAATVISCAKSLSKGLAMFSDTVTSTLTGTKAPPPPPVSNRHTGGQQANRPGIVTIVDVLGVSRGQMSVQEDSDGEGLIAHFPAHATEPLTAMEFDSSGSLLLTADILGHHFHVFKVMAHPISCSLGAVHHLYTLYRGDTTAKVQDLTFSPDSRWVAISSLRGTTHVFPITPYGGNINVRTHTSPHIVNRASLYHRSAGLDEMAPTRPSTHSSARDSPHGSPGSSPSRDHLRHLTHHHNAINSQLCNPRLPPYPHPTMVYPLVQIQTRSMLVPGGSDRPGSGGGGRTGSGGQQQGMTTGDKVCVAACFARSRGWVMGSPNMSRERHVSDQQRRYVESLFIVNKQGELVEHLLEPQLKAGIEKGTEESPVQLLHIPRAQWNLGRVNSSAELRPPLSPTNALILACDAVVTSQRTSAEFPSSPVSRHESRESLSSSEHSWSENGGSGSTEDKNNEWLSEVEILTYAGPHRRLWMGPQFTFKTFQGTSSTTTVYPSNSSVLMSHSPESPSLDDDQLDLHSLKLNPAPRSSPMAMPGGQRLGPRGARFTSDASCSPHQPFIEAGSFEQGFVDAYPSLGMPAEPPIASCGVTGDEEEDEQLKESIADAMSEASAPASSTSHHHHHHGLAKHHRELGDHGSFETLSTSSGSASSALSATRLHSFDAARGSPTQTIEHVMVFPSNNGSPED